VQPAAEQAARAQVHPPVRHTALRKALLPDSAFDCLGPPSPVSLEHFLARQHGVATQGPPSTGATHNGTFELALRAPPRDGRHARSRSAADSASVPDAAALFTPPHATVRPPSGAVGGERLSDAPASSAFPVRVGSKACSRVSEAGTGSETPRESADLESASTAPAAVWGGGSAFQANPLFDARSQSPV